MAAIAYPHVDLMPGGIPVIAGTRTKVEEIVLEHLAYRWDGLEIQRQHPDLTLGQIHSALAYYYDHQVEMDEAIEQGLHQVAQIQIDLGESPVRLKLKAKGLLP